MFYVSDEESWTQQKRLNIIVLDIIPVRTTGVINKNLLECA